LAFITSTAIYVEGDANEVLGDSLGDWGKSGDCDLLSRFLQRLPVK
jgi:hypothetical protein